MTTRVGGGEHVFITRELSDDGGRASAPASVGAESGPQQRFSTLQERRARAMASAGPPSVSVPLLPTASAGPPSVSVPLLPTASAVSSADSPSPPQAWKMTLLYPKLFNSEQSGIPLLSHATSQEFRPPNDTWKCGAAIDDIVLHPSGKQLYVILEEYCFVDGDNTRRRFSVRKADIARAHRGSNSLEKHTLLSYWWPYSKGSGPMESSSFISRNGANSTISMAMVNCLDVTTSGDYLVMGATPSVGTWASVVLMSTRNGNRTSFSAPADYLWSVAYNPERTHLYVSDIAQPVRILSTAVNPSGMPMDGADWTVVRTFRHGDAENISSVQFGAESFLRDGTCLYFADSDHHRVWGIDPRNSSANATLIAGTGETGSLDGNGSNSLFYTPADVVATEDGCNVFVTEWHSGLLRWLKLDAPCSTARSVHTVARYGRGLWGLTIQQSDEGISLYVGSRDASVFELRINNSQLHACGTRLSSPTSSVSSSPPLFAGSLPTPLVGGDSSSAISRFSALFIALSASAVALLALIACVTFFGCRARGRGGQTSSLSSAAKDSAVTIGDTSGAQRGQGLRPSQVRQFTLARLSHCTRNFSKTYRIGGSGAFGYAYWGEIDGKELAIKVMTGDLTEEKRSTFLAEVNALSRVHHVNLIKLVGYCDEGNRAVLVYPYFPGGSLYARLHKRTKAAAPGKPSLPPPTPGKPPLRPLTLVERMCIAWQVAKGIGYLHDSANPSIIHRDIKSSNVLLGDGWEGVLYAVVADVGLTTIAERVFGRDHQTAVRTSRLGGTFGYMAPEYGMKGVLSQKIDVYAFGVIFLELMTGRKAVTKASSGHERQTLVDWAQPYLNRGAGYLGAETLNQILDPCLRADASSHALKTMVTEALALANKCLSVNPDARPTMSGLAGKIRDLLVEANVSIPRG